MAQYDTRLAGVWPTVARSSAGENSYHALHSYPRSRLDPLHTSAGSGKAINIVTHHEVLSDLPFRTLRVGFQKRLDTLHHAFRCIFLQKMTCILEPIRVFFHVASSPTNVSSDTSPFTIR